MTQELKHGDRVEVTLPSGEKIQGRIRGMRKFVQFEGPIYDIDYYEDTQMHIMMGVSGKRINKYNS